MNIARKPRPAEHLKNVIEERFESIPKFAEEIGISKAFLYKILNGDACPTLDVASAIARPLKLSLDELSLALGRPLDVETGPVRIA